MCTVLAFQLDLSHNLIGMRGCKVLNKVLQGTDGQRSHLVDLNLEANHLGDRAMTVIADGLENCRTLRRLNLRNNSVGDVGAEALGSALIINTSLVQVREAPHFRLASSVCTDFGP